MKQGKRQAMQSNNPLDPQSYDGIFDSRTHEGGHKGNRQDYWQDSQNVLRDIRWHGEHVMPANLFHFYSMFFGNAYLTRVR